MITTTLVPVIITFRNLAVVCWVARFWSSWLSSGKGIRTSHGNVLYWDNEACKLGKKKNRRSHPLLRRSRHRRIKNNHSTVPLRRFPVENSVAFPGKSQLSQGGAPQLADYRGPKLSKTQSGPSYVMWVYLGKRANSCFVQGHREKVKSALISRESNNKFHHS